MLCFPNSMKWVGCFEVFHHICCHNILTFLIQPVGFHDSERFCKKHFNYFLYIDHWLEKYYLNSIYTFVIHSFNIGINYEWKSCTNLNSVIIKKVHKPLFQKLHDQVAQFSESSNWKNKLINFSFIIYIWKNAYL